jgi:hypothetical protein
MKKPNKANMPYGGKYSDGSSATFGAAPKIADDHRSNKTGVPRYKGHQFKGKR